MAARHHEHRQPGWSLFTDGCPGGESVTSITARCDSFIAKIERMASGRPVVAFTHGHLSRALAARLLDVPVQAASGFYNETATVGVFDHRRGALVLTGWNLTAG
jgi:probable phosphoglycerate mutase